MRRIVDPKRQHLSAMCVAIDGRLIRDAPKLSTFDRSVLGESVSVKHISNRARTGNSSQIFSSHLNSGFLDAMNALQHTTTKSFFSNMKTHYHTVHNDRVEVETLQIRRMMTLSRAA